jgi:diacylglycerol kinase
VPEGPEVISYREMKSDKFSIKSRLASFRFAFNGIKNLLKHEHNSRIHLAAAIIAIISGFLFKLDRLEWGLLLIVIALVFIAELFNSALEALADHVEPSLNDLIGKAKDYSAAAVLVSALIALTTGLLIFIPRIVNILHTSPA